MNQSAYLQAMGIDIWQEKNIAKNQEKSEKNRLITYRLLDQSKNIFGYLLASIEFNATSETETLVQKIAASIATQAIVCDWKIESPETKNAQILVLFGHVPSISLDIKTRLEIIQCVSVEAIQKNAAQKSEVWQQLKPIAARFK